MTMLETVQSLLKSKKQKLYEKHILDSKGQLKLYHPITQAMLLDLLEAQGLEKRLDEFDKEMEKEMKEKRCGDC